MRKAQPFFKRLLCHSPGNSACNGTVRTTTTGRMAREMTPHIVCIGGALIDRKYRLKGEALPGTSNPAAVAITFGGVARNVAENLARLGLRVSLAAALGADEAGRSIRDHLVGLGVDLSLLPAGSAATTSEYAAILDRAGDLVVAASAMDEAEVAMDTGTDRILAKVPADAMVFAEANLSRTALGKVIAAARGRFLALDAISVAKAARLPEQLDGVSLMVMNHDEAAAWLGTAAPAAEMAASILQRGALTAVVTCGRDGVWIADAAGIMHAPAAPATVIDVTGAGDSLTAAMLWRIASGDTPRRALSWGLAAAAATIGSPATVHPEMSSAFLEARISRSSPP